jgi:putative NIF3 family GTP cyclohydrolase 1 type 2
MSQGAGGEATWLISISNSVAHYMKTGVEFNRRCKNLLPRIASARFLCSLVAMPKAKLADIVRRCQKLLRPETFTDWEGAVNGLQVENSGQVGRIAACVDASLATIKLAIAAGADLMIVHHGLFWSPTVPWTGPRREMLEQLVKNNLAVYSSHLPLDAHPRLGNNALLCAALGFKNLRPFFLEKGRHIGWQTRSRISREALVEKLASMLGTRPFYCPAATSGVSGSASSPAEQAAA